MDWQKACTIKMATGRSVLERWKWEWEIWNLIFLNLPMTADPVMRFLFPPGCSGTREACWASELTFWSWA